jgi:hypothetical protein
MTKRRTCDDCNPLWDRKLNVKAIQLCPLHAAAPALLSALEHCASAIAVNLEGTSPETEGTFWFSAYDEARAAIEAANKS